jgi:hypothetical protein
MEVPIWKASSMKHALIICLACLTLTACGEHQREHKQSGIEVHGKLGVGVVVELD